MAGTTALPMVVAAVLAMAPLTDAVVRSEVDRLVPEVARARHLTFRGMLAARAVGRDAIDAHVAAALAGRVATANVAGEEQILKRLGLIDGAADYTRLWAAGASSAPGPIYDPATQRLLVPDFLPLDGQHVALIHEIAHAFADQRFDVRQFLAPPTLPLDGDTTRARLAIVEGDATLTAMEVVDPSGAFLRPAALAEVAERLRAASGESRPPWLAALGRFVHVDGFLFLAQVRAQRPWSAIDALWRDPPASSEQLLHREKYEACEAPIAVPEAALPALPGFDRPNATDVLGELVIRAWLSTALPPEIAVRAAAGWGGDRVAIYRAADRGAAAREPAPARPDGGAALPPPEPPPLAWLTVWDDGGEADDFARAAAAVPGATVQRRNEAVAIFLGAPDLAPAALDGMLDGWRDALRPRATRGARPRRAAQPDCRRRDRAAAPR